MSLHLKSDYVRDVIAKAGYDQKDVARLIKVHPSHVSLWLTGRSGIRITSARKLAAVLNVPVGSIVDVTDRG